jgi:acyl carrier protein
MMATSQYNEIFQQVKSLLLQYAPQQAPIQDDTDLINDLGFDSLRVMDMLNEVEDVFDITYPINDLASLHTVKDFVLQIQKIVENN